MKSFPKDFVWGTATSSYQVEGGHNLGGRGPSIWDAFCTIPGKVRNGENGNVACDHFHRWKEDVALMKEMGVNAYRFSISWSRVLPTGTGKVNMEGIEFYDNLINELKKNDIEPWITLYHWDLPLTLQMEADGWLNPKMADHFADYARVCFEHFGDRVKNWITLNESWVVAMLGYGQGVFAPGRSGNVEPYFAGHQLIRAHGKAVQVFRSEFAHQQGQIGISNNCDWREPLTDSVADREAAQRALEFFLSWFADPIYLGDYPQVMKDRLGDRLPSFTNEDKKIIHGSSDFFGLNHYTTMLVSDASGKLVESSVYGNGGLSEDQDVNLSLDPDWKLTDMQWAIVPWGCRKMLSWITDRYDRPPIYITENGCAYPDEPHGGEVVDLPRLNFYREYLEACHQAIEDGVDLKGYFAWSFMDNFEWASGYHKRFGVHYVDFDTLERIPKSSAKWFREVMTANAIK